MAEVIRDLIWVSFFIWCSRSTANFLKKRGDIGFIHTGLQICFLFFCIYLFQEICIIIIWSSLLENEIKNVKAWKELFDNIRVIPEGYIFCILVRCWLIYDKER